MCGIGCWYGNTIDFRQKDFDRFMDKIIHRGPDHQGVMSLETNLFIGNNRLAIIDNKPRSHQPLAYENFTISFNGAIYNFEEIRLGLRQKGHQFLTESDTEVIIHAYAEYGAACVDYFEGMWAFIIYDRQHKTLFCSRDRFGIKPLYYEFNKDYFAVASELKQFDEIPNRVKNVNLAHVQYYLESGGFNNHNEQTFIEGINQLLPGNNLFINTVDYTIKTRQYYDLKKVPSIDSLSIKQTIKDAVDKRLIGDIDPCILFSGGIDSSIILQYALKEKPNINSYSFIEKRDKNLDESTYIQSFIERYPHKNTSTSMEDELDQLIKEAILSQDGPPASLSTMAQLLVYKLARRNGEKLSLSGQGADEIFGGYNRNLSLISPKDLLKSPIKTVQFLQSNLKLIQSRILKTKQRNSLFDDNQFQFPAIKSISEYMLYLMNQNGLRDLLHYEDRNSMSQGIESRVPFLDRKLVEMAYHLSDTDKLKNLKRKGILIAEFEEEIPSKILHRKTKLAFDTPEKDLLENNYFDINKEYHSLKETLPELKWNKNFDIDKDGNLFMYWQMKFLNVYLEEL